MSNISRNRFDKERGKQSKKENYKEHEKDEMKQWAKIESSRARRVLPQGKW